jgi:hypothetical protein
MTHTLEWGVKLRPGDTAIAAYGARTIYHEPDWGKEAAPRLDFVAGRTDHFGSDDDTWAELKNAVNTLLRDLAEEQIYNLLMEYKFPEEFYIAVVLLDVGRYKVYVQRQRYYVNITFAMYDEPIDVTEITKLVCRKLSRKRSALFKRRVREAFEHNDTLSMPTINMIWKQVKAEVV